MVFKYLSFDTYSSNIRITTKNDFFSFRVFFQVLFE